MENGVVANVPDVSATVILSTGVSSTSGIPSTLCPAGASVLSSAPATAPNNKVAVMHAAADAAVSLLNLFFINTSS